MAGRIDGDEPIAVGLGATGAQGSAAGHERGGSAIGSSCEEGAKLLGSEISHIRCGKAA